MEIDKKADSQYAKLTSASTHGENTENNDFIPEYYESNGSILHYISTFWSTLTYSWIKPLLTLGNQRALISEDLIPLFALDQGQNIYNLFQNAWNEQLTHGFKASLPKAMVKAFSFPFIMAGLLKLVHDTCLFSGPYLLNKIILFLKSPTAKFSEGLTYVLLLLVTQVMMAVCLRQYFW